MDFDVRVSSHGPVFDGRADAAATAFVSDAEREVAKQGVDDVRQALHHVLRNPTGYYESRIQTEGNRVADGNVIYGPWLEGVGSRNKSTRFKGYFTFRRVTQILRAKSSKVAERVLPKYLGRMQ